METLKRRGFMTLLAAAGAAAVCGLKAADTMAAPGAGEAAAGAPPLDAATEATEVTEATEPSLETNQFYIVRRRRWRRRRVVYLRPRRRVYYYRRPRRVRFYRVRRVRRFRRW